MSKSFEMSSKFVKYDAALGLVFGYAIVCKVDDKEYFDVQGDHIPEDSMMEAATDFMLSKREGKVMHSGARVGDIVFAWPLTTDIAKAFDLKTSKTGLLIAYRPTDPDIVDKVKNGDYTGFSIGGRRVKDEDEDEEDDD